MKATILAAMVSSLCIVMGCRSSSEVADVSDRNTFRFEYEDKPYEIVSRRAQGDGIRNYLLAREGQVLVLRAVDENRDGVLDSLLLNTRFADLDLAGANLIYHAGILDANQRGMLRELAAMDSTETLTGFQLNEQEYFEFEGVNVMAFQDIYPEGHQGGVSIIQHGVRTSSNGDLRLEPTPGQWQPVPKQLRRVVDIENNVITTWLSYPDPDKNRKGFNPIDYPDLELSYSVSVAAQGESVRVRVDLDKPLPPEWVGKVGFNFELFPPVFFGASWYLGDASGVFPLQANGPVQRDTRGEMQPTPLAVGSRLTVAAEDPARQLVIESLHEKLQLLDGRHKHNNGWFVVRSEVAAGATAGAVEWIVRPNAIPGWLSPPVIQVSQVGYHPAQSKVAVIELDKRDIENTLVELIRISENGGAVVVRGAVPDAFDREFLRYRYERFDFSDVTEEGMYLVRYRGVDSDPFRIAKDIYEHDAWQPTLEYFLPVQMCHMRVEEQYRVWHGACHLDDARMAPADSNHFDGYSQIAETLTPFDSGEHVPGLDRGGWHDAGDDDLRIESQADELYVLASMYELFDVRHDNTTIDQDERLVRIHQPDGLPDLLQQVEHGVLTVLGSYRALGRVYDGMIVPTLQQYVLLGDVVNSTDNLVYDTALAADSQSDAAAVGGLGPDGKPRGPANRRLSAERTADRSGAPDDRWVFTERNPSHEYKAVAALAIASRVLREYKPALARECLEAAEAIWSMDRASDRGFRDQVVAATELLLSTDTTSDKASGKTLDETEYRSFFLDHQDEIVDAIGSVGWSLGRIMETVSDLSFSAAVEEAVREQFASVIEEQRKTPYGVPYEPYIWGAGWGVQRFGVEQYYLHRGFPQIVSADYMLNALNFVLGVHPGSNTSSLASGVGARSVTVGYGLNRADWSYIPGGVASGTALIRPDFPELKEFPYLWQQVEYVMGGGATHFMFLVLAADQILNER